MPSQLNLTRNKTEMTEILSIKNSKIFCFDLFDPNILTYLKKITVSNSKLIQSIRPYNNYFGFEKI